MSCAQLVTTLATSIALMGAVAPGATADDPSIYSGGDGSSSDPFLTDSGSACSLEPPSPHMSLFPLGPQLPEMITSVGDGPSSDEPDGGGGGTSGAPGTYPGITDTRWGFWNVTPHLCPHGTGTAGYQMVLGVRYPGGALHQATIDWLLSWKRPDGKWAAVTGESGTRTLVGSFDPRLRVEFIVDNYMRMSGLRRGRYKLRITLTNLNATRPDGVPYRLPLKPWFEYEFDM